MISSEATVIGLTGPFGSGCTTVSDILIDRKYKTFLFSSILHERWHNENPKRKPLRSDLQSLGNKIRETSGNPGALAEIAIGKMQEDDKEWSLITIDGIRNLGEIEVLREYFGRRFYLIALECPASERWRRLQPWYKKES